MAYKNKFLTYREILAAISTGLPTRGGEIKKQTGLFSSELSIYIKELEELGALERIQLEKTIRPVFKITKKGKKIVTALNDLQTALDSE